MTHTPQPPQEKGVPERREFLSESPPEDTKYQIVRTAVGIMASSPVSILGYPMRASLADQIVKEHKALSSLAASHAGLLLALEKFDHTYPVYWDDSGDCILCGKGRAHDLEDSTHLESCPFSAARSALEKAREAMKGGA